MKLHSQGEFVFDWGWAEAADRMGIPYYPKLLVGVPFTPVTGQRLLTIEGERARLMPMLARLLIEIVEIMELSSAHVNFATREEIDALESAGFLRKHGEQYHWYRKGELSFDDYLARFDSKQRNQIKRERREVQKQGISISIEGGGAIDPKAAFDLYKTTIDKMYWGRQYLNLRTFELWKERMPERIELVAARKNGKLVAGAFNFKKGKRLFGRYWGCHEEIRHLHFNVCYYAGIEECFEQGLDVFEPGAGGEHKLARGFEPSLQLSAHWIRNERFREILKRHLEMEGR